MKIIGINNGNKKSDNSPYCWIYYTEENPNVDGVMCDRLFFRKHIDLSVGDTFELVFHKGTDGKYYPDDVRSC